MSLNFFFLSAGAKVLFCFIRFSIASGMGRSDSEVIWDSSFTDLDLTTSALTAWTSGSSHSVFTNSLVSFNEAGRVLKMLRDTAGASSSSVFVLQQVRV